ncbi:MAG: hypothetical protein FJX47_04260 [Alphaproteobacteria bacterium]|nr:hypothetical protein [Alphaproteobacteria bacterium]
MAGSIGRVLALAVLIGAASCAEPPPAPRASAGTGPAPTSTEWRDGWDALPRLAAAHPALAGPAPRVERVFVAQTIRHITPGSGIRDDVFALEYAFREMGDGADAISRKTVGKSLWRPQAGARSTFDVDARGDFVTALGGLYTLAGKERNFNTAANAFAESGNRVTEIRRVEGGLFPLAQGNRLTIETLRVSSDGKRSLDESILTVRDRRHGFVADGIAVEGDVFEVETVTVIRALPEGRVTSRGTARQFYATAGNAVIARDIVSEILNEAGGVASEYRRKDTPIFFTVGRESGAAKAEADRFASGLNRFLAAFAEEQFKPILALADLGAPPRPAQPAQAPAPARAQVNDQPCEKTAGGAIASALVGAGFAALMGGGRSDMLSAAGNNAVKYLDRPNC